MNYSVAMTQAVRDELQRHLTRPDGQEDLCFALWYPSTGRTRITAIVKEVILPAPGERNVHGNVSFNPQYFERVIEAALHEGAGIAFLHSHPRGLGWQGMSRDDVRAEKRISPSVYGATRIPLVGLTLAAGDGTWSARVWERKSAGRFSPKWVGSVRVVGETLVVHFNDKAIPVPEHRQSQIRTIAAWGPEAQAHLARLKIGVVGLGSVGSIVAEALARTGVRRVQLLDYQRLEELNLDRTLNATRDDAKKGRPKTEIAARALRKSATAKGFRVEADQFSVCEEDGFRQALDCDLLFSCVDRPWARSVLNAIAYGHLIPVIDGGILVTRTKTGKLRGADWKAHTVGPGHRCMLCLGQYDPGLVQADRRGDLDDPTYIESLPKEHPIRANENVFGFSLGVASLEIMQLLMLVIAPLGLSSSGPQNYHLLTGHIGLGGTNCDPGCVFLGLIGAGDQLSCGMDEHSAAVAARMS